MWFILFVVLSAVLNASARLPAPCFSRVYCYGPLLHTVQVSKIFNDSKTFVDMKMKNPYATTLVNFERFMMTTNRTPTKDEVKVFVDDNFEDGNELENWEPPDYSKNPKFLGNISDYIVRDVARQVVELWPVLGRKVKPEVIGEPSKYSFMPVLNGFIVPGGRFTEYYYWDSYWIINGLLICEMGDTVKGMIDNFIYLIKNYNFVPNGGRIYYLNRSQPPLLTKMVMAYFKYSKNRKWLRENIQYLNQEMQYWLEKKTVKIEKNNNSYIMAHYNAASTGPRPESYVQDLNTAAFYPEPADKDELYVELKSAAESGWDFSSRWIFDHRGGNFANLTRTQARRVIPVDLNSYLCEAFKSLSYLYSELSDYNNTMYWRKMGMYWQKSIEEVLWDNEAGIWFDYDYQLSQPRRYFYPSNIAPLWCGCFDKHKGETLGKRAFKYLSQTGALDTPGGIAASLLETGEQWDFPNAWAPSQAMIVQALERSEAPDVMAEAKKIAVKWIKANIRGFKDSGEMFEKYDSLDPGKFGRGGEYPVQSGYGWTNGVALEFIYKYFTSDQTENEIK